MNITIIQKYFQTCQDECYQKIEDNTAFDLNLDELFDSIDYTHSPIGQQYLYKILRTIPNTKSIIAENEKWIYHYSNDISSKNKIQKLLAKLDNSDAYYIYSLLLEDYKPFTELQIYLYRCLQFIPAAFLLSFCILKSWIFIIGLIIFFIINLAIHYSSKSKLFVYSGSIPMLRQMISICRSLNKNADLKCDLINDTKIREALISTKELYRKASSYRFLIKFESDITMMAWLISEIMRVFFLSEVINLHRIFQLIEREKQDLIYIYEFVGLVDALTSVSKMRDNLDYYCIPTFEKDRFILKFEDIYHPLIQNCVANSLDLTKHSFLIMGSNMSGKTSFIRTVGLNVLLSQTLNTSFAKKMILCKQRIHSVITVKDSLVDGKSYYLSEVLQIRTLLDKASDGKNLILLDELFKGTNTIERVAAAAAVLKFLLQGNSQNRILVATHDLELITLLNAHYSKIFFEEDIQDNTLSFNYKITFTPTKNRNAIRILEVYDYPDEILKNALNIIALTQT